MISALRKDAREYLGGGDSLSLTKICTQLRRNKDYRRKREAKALSKKELTDSLQQSLANLKVELAQIEGELGGSTEARAELERTVSQYDQLLGVDKRLCTDAFDKPIAELDA